MTDEIRRLLADAADSDGPDALAAGADTAAVVTDWLKIGRSRRHRRRLGVGLAIGTFTVMLTVIAVNARSGERLETLPFVGSGPVATALVGVPAISPSPVLDVNPAGAPSLRIEPATIHAGDVVRLGVVDPPGRPFLRTPLTTVQRNVAGAWITVFRQLSYTAGQRVPAGMCGQSEQRLSSGFAGSPPWNDDPFMLADPEGRHAFAMPCVESDFTIGSATPELAKWTGNLVAGDYRVCRDAAPATGDPVARGGDATAAVRICADLRVTGPEPPSMFRVDGPCPVPGDGTMPPMPLDPMAPQPNAVGFRDPARPAGSEPTVLWKSSATNVQARRPGAAIALFDLNCNIVAYSVAGGTVSSAELEAVSADFAGAQAKQQFMTVFREFEVAPDGPGPVSSDQALGVGVSLCRIVVPRLSYSVEAMQGTNPGLAHGRPGHVVTTPQPGEDGNAVFHGLGGGFSHVSGSVLRELVVGDEVDVQQHGSTFRYRVVAQGDGRPFLLSAPEDADKSYLAPTEAQTITLMDGDLEAGNGGLIVVQARRVED